MTEDPQITAADRKAVRDLILGLIEDSRREEQEQLHLKATATWLSAFSSFKRMRKQIGLPDFTDRSQVLAYGSLLAALKFGGKALLCQMERNIFNPAEVISTTAFASCVAEISSDDLLLDGGYLAAAEDPQFSALFSTGPQTAA